MTVVATAGHVDHGKSALVRALTGTDPDRFAEEKARGLTLDLGFAFTTLPSGAEIAFVDVPGHARYLDNMLAGVGAVRTCLFVVDAREGWRTQSEEHLRVLDLLGVNHGVVALTKRDLVDADTLAAVADDVARRVDSSSLAASRTVPVDSLSGAGLDELRQALDDLVRTAPAAIDRARPRLWVDRSFSARGAGAVVTGTLTGGTLGVGDTVAVIPGDRAVRVRGLQRHGVAVDAAAAGTRVAVNLAGIEHRQIERGHALVFAGQWAPTREFDASLTVMASLDHDMSRRGAFRLHVGSGMWPVTVRALRGTSLAPGVTGAVRVHAPVTLPLVPGDRYVLRDSGRSETVGGGEVLDIAPVLPARLARPDRSVTRVVAERGWADVDEVERLTGERVAPTVGNWVVDPAVIAAAKVTGGFSEQRANAKRPPTHLAAALRGMVAPLVVDEDVGGHPYLDALRSAPFAPPPPHDVDRAALRRLREKGLAVERDGVWFATEAVERAAGVVAGLVASASEGVTVTEVRTALGTTRKYAVPLLSHLDSIGVTRRRGDVRVAGPRMPRP